MRFISSLMVAILLLLGFTVWPARYRYDKVPLDGVSRVLRTNRMTGHSAYFADGGFLLGPRIALE